MSIEKETALLIQNVVRKTGWIDLPAEGNSMYPFIQHGDVCRFILCDAFSLKKGDIVLYISHSGKLVAHRFYQARKDQNLTRFIFKGDTNLGFDEPIAPHQMIGKLNAIQKNRLRINARSLPADLWGKLIISVPVLSGLFRYHLNRRRAG